MDVLIGVAICAVGFGVAWFLRSGGLKGSSPDMLERMRLLFRRYPQLTNCNSAPLVRSFAIALDGRDPFLSSLPESADAGRASLPRAGWRPAEPRAMISGLLHLLRAFLNRKLSRFPPNASEPEMTTEEHAALMKALNPPYRVYLRHESRLMVDVAWDEERGKEAAVGQCMGKP